MPIARSFFVFLALASANSAAAATTTVCASCDLQSAVDAAADGDTLVLAGGSYTGGITINKDLTLQASSWSIIDADGDAWAVKVTAGASAHLQMLNLTGASTTGLWVEGEVTTYALYLSDNTAPFGAALVSGYLALHNSAIVNNTSTSYYAGGVNVIGGDADVTSTTFMGNSGTYGGGLTNISGDVSLHGASFIANNAYLGAGAYNAYGTLSVTASAFSANHATTLGGGWSNHTHGGTVTTSGVGYANNSTDSGTYADCYDVSGGCTP